MAGAFAGNGLNSMYLKTPPPGTPYGPIGMSRFGISAQAPQAAQAGPENSLSNQYKLYDTAVGESAKSYDDIMGGYKSLGNSPISAPQMTPQTYSFAPTQDYKSSLSNLQDLSKTGGYSEEDKSNIRARGISPIRAVYANAQQNINRQRSLQGGYSPNYTAATAKMSRDLSQGIADQTTNVEAGLAQNIAQNRLSISPVLAQIAARESELENQYGSRNADAMNDASRFNIGTQLDTDKYNQGQKLQALEGMRSLYGTTPALANLFGDQAMRTAQMVQNNVQNQVGTGSNLARVASRY